MEFLRYGEEGIRVVFGEGVDPEVNEKVRRCYYFVRRLRVKNILDIIPSFRSCLIHFDRERTSFEYLAGFLREREGEMESTPVPAPAQHEIPVLYGGEHGPDMEFISSYSGLGEEEVIEIHAGCVYTVFAVGFMPGFPYLGPLDKRLYTPRLETPRLKVPEGSVGLAQLQTGIYPFESPAGWRILGKTDVNLFDYRREPCSLMAIGDKVRFIRI